MDEHDEVLCYSFNLIKSMLLSLMRGLQTFVFFFLGPNLHNYPNKHETLTPCYFTVVPPSTSLAQR